MQGLWKDNSKNFKKDKIKVALKRAYKKQLKENQTIFVSDDSNYKYVYDSKFVGVEKTVFYVDFIKEEKTSFDFNQCVNCPFKDSCSVEKNVAWNKNHYWKAPLYCYVLYRDPLVKTNYYKKTAYENNNVWFDFYTNEPIPFKVNSKTKTNKSIFVEERNTIGFWTFESGSDVEVIYGEKVDTFFYRKYHSGFNKSRKKYHRTLANKTARRKAKEWVEKIKKDPSKIDIFQNPKNFPTEKSIKREIY